MAVSKEFGAYILERLESIGEIQSRKMFGGLGLYLGSVFFALVADNVLYFKVDESNLSDYEKAGMEPFQPFGRKSYKMSYYEVPAEVIDDDRLLRKWADKAFSVAVKSKKNK